MRTSLIVSVALVPALLAPPAAASTPSPSPQVVSQPSYASPSPSPSPAPDAVVVGNADSGRTVRLVPGQELQVELLPPSQGEQWQGPATTGGLYLTAYSESAERTAATLQALRPAVEPVVLRARTDRACFHSDDPCPQAFSEWSLSVVVDEGSFTPSYTDCYAMPTPSVAPGHAYVDETSHGTRVQVERGKSVQVGLGGCDQDPYAVPVSSGPMFRESVAYAVNGRNLSVFRALRLGTTTITSFTDPSCFHTTSPCARPSQHWSVEVEVVPEVADDRCLVPMQVELDQDTITATAAAGLSVRTAAGVRVDLYAYTRPSTTFRRVRTQVADSSGVARFSVRPPANTRLYAQREGCDPGPSVVLNVRTALSLAVERTGPREYVFSGDSLPARSGGLVVSLYRLTDGGRSVLTAQARADAADGEWRLVRRFTGTGRFGFVVRTGQDLQNAPGTSNVRSLLVF